MNKEYISGLDKYLSATAELLKTKYENVSMNRGKNSVTFFYSNAEGDHQFSLDKSDVIKYFLDNETPKEIHFLLEVGDKSLD
jgi:hypothetical protein